MQRHRPVRHLRTIGRVFSAGWLLLLLLACCTSRTITQAGLVPFSEPDPPPSSHGAGGVVVSGSGLTELDARGDVTNGDYVPAGQLHIGGMLRPIAGLMIRPMGMLAFASGAGSVGTGMAPGGVSGPTPLAPPDGPSFGLGVDLGYMLGDESTGYLVHPHVGAFGVGLSSRFADPAGAPPQSSVAGMGVVEGGIDLGYWVTPWLLLMGSLDMRNMPAFPSQVTTCAGNDPPFVGFGTFTMTTRLSFEVQVTEGFGFFAGAAIPAYGSPFASYPILTGGLRGSFGDGRVGLRTPREPEERTIDESGDDAPRTPAWGAGS